MANVLIGGSHHAVSRTSRLVRGSSVPTSAARRMSSTSMRRENNWGGNIGGGLFLGSGTVTVPRRRPLFQVVRDVRRLPRDHRRQAGVLARNGRRRLHVVTTFAPALDPALHSLAPEPRRRAAETRHRRRHSAQQSRQQRIVADDHHVVGLRPEHVRQVFRIVIRLQARVARRTSPRDSRCASRSRPSRARAACRCATPRRA